VTKVLLAVDDSVTMRKAYELTFSGEEFQVITADSAESALREVAIGPAVILVDTYLDPTDGYELARELRKRSPASAMVLVTSRHHPFDDARGQGVHAEDSIDKPFDTQQLIERVRGAIAKRASTPTQSSEPAVISERSPAAAAAAAAPGVPAGPAGQAVPTMPPAHVERTTLEPISLVPAPSSAPMTPGVLWNQAGGTQGWGNQAAGREFADKLVGLGLTQQQVDAVLALSRDVVERVVWEVVPPLAETMIREEITRLTADR
jgi:CheY-like chemotaxis protein